MKLLEKLRKQSGQAVPANPPTKSWTDLSPQECVELIEQNINYFFQRLDLSYCSERRSFIDMLSPQTINGFVEERYDLKAEIIEVAEPIIVAPLTGDQKFYRLGLIYGHAKEMPLEPELPAECADDCNYQLWVSEDGSLVLFSLAVYMSPDHKEIKTKFMKFRPFDLQELIPVLADDPSRKLANSLLSSIQARVSEKIWAAETRLWNAQADVDDLYRLKKKTRLDCPYDTVR